MQPITCRNQAAEISERTVKQKTVKPNSAGQMWEYWYVRVYVCMYGWMDMCLYTNVFKFNCGVTINALFLDLFLFWVQV